MFWVWARDKEIGWGMLNGHGPWETGGWEKRGRNVQMGDRGQTKKRPIDQLGKGPLTHHMSVGAGISRYSSPGAEGGEGSTKSY
jgi:hypothetical protein